MTVINVTYEQYVKLMSRYFDMVQILREKLGGYEFMIELMDSYEIIQEIQEQYPEYQNMFLKELSGES